MKLRRETEIRTGPTRLAGQNELARYGFDVFERSLWKFGRRVVWRGSWSAPREVIFGWHSDPEARLKYARITRLVDQ